MKNHETKPPIEEDQLLSTRQVAEILNVTDQNARLLVYYGRLPSVRIIRQYRVRMSDLKRFMEQNKIGGR